ncbi:MAG TPA: RHS repeat-associated core domain-containing protein [Actinophytocola sp.]|nr:RHS repeat-associated core domain-containing protein [Actinophytocola sp.]
MTVSTASAGRVRVANSPLWAEPVTGTAGKTAASGPISVRAGVVDQRIATRAGITGVILTATPGAGSPTGVRVGLDYSGLAGAYGGGFGSRLRLVKLPDCVLTTPEVPACQVQTPVESVNDAKTASLSTVIPTRLSGKEAAAAGGDTAAPRMVLAAVSGGDSASGGGSFSATTLTPSGSWAAGLQSGAFTYAYPIMVPPAASSLAPKVGLSYDSGSVDARTASSQAQASWVGDGWSTPSSFIEQSFVPCADSPGGSPSPVATQDQCYAGQILTISLNGSSTALVWDAGRGVYRLAGDDGSVVTRITGSNNGSGTYNTEYWTVTQRDGTKYFFGRNQLPGWSAGKPTTNSVDSVPVFSSHPGDPCYNPAGFAQSRCTMAYRWNLDYVVDIHRNAMSYFYKQDTNYYGANNGTANVSYVRDSHLDHIDYGFVDGAVYTSAAPNQVLFTTGDRCLSGICSPLSASTASNWPDVPYDLNCAAGASCATRSPSFWSTVRLTTIATQQYSTAQSRYLPVDSWALTQTIPGFGAGNPTSPTLWLSGITRTGQDTTAGGSSSPITLPTISFAGQGLQNRVDTLTDNLVPLTRMRISAITTETGATIGVAYAGADCTGPVSIDPSANTHRCFPVKWTPPGRTQPVDDWFHKYPVVSVTETDNTGRAPATFTGYTYRGAAWHYDDNEIVQPKNRTWGQWRGYAGVQVRTGHDPDSQTLSDTTYYQGMDGDILPNNVTRSITMIDSQGGAHRDAAQLAGRVLESTSYRGDGGPIDGSTITSYWISPPNATRARTGLPALTAVYTGPAETWSRQAITSTTPTSWRITETDHTYDPATGLLVHTYDHGDLAHPEQVTCTTTSYAPANTAANLVGLVSEVEVLALPCGGSSPNGASAPGSGQLNALTAPATVNRPGDVISAVRTFYDNPALARTWPQPANPTWPQPAPTVGDVSVIRAATGYTGGSYTYQTTNAVVADSYGRPVENYDARGNKTTTAYTMSGNLVTAVAGTNALGQTSSTTIGPARGLVVATKDPNNITATLRYDALGRLVSAWGASRPTTSPPNVTFAYALSQTAPSVVTSTRMNEGQGVILSTAIFDSLLRPVQTQTPTPQGGRLLTNTFYDSHGWVTKKNNPYWSSDTPPNGTLVQAPDNEILNQERYTYDGLARPISTVSTRAAVPIETTSTVYQGDRTTVFPPSGGVITSTVVDARGRTTHLDQYTTGPTVSAPANTFTGVFGISGGVRQTTRFTYDHQGRPWQRIDPAGNTWTTTYNLLGQVTSSSDPDTGTTTTSYDPAGNIAATTDANNRTLSYAYDALNRKIAQYNGPNTSSPKLASWTYDGAGATPALANAIGHLTAQSSYVVSGGVTYAYTQANTGGFNNWGKSLADTVTIPSIEGALAGSYKVTHQYTANTSLPARDIYTAAGGLPAEAAAYAYAPPLDLPTGVAGGTVAFASNTTYDAYSRPIQEQINYGPNFGYLSYSYDDHTGRLATSGVYGSPARIQDVAYRYDLAGNLTSQTTVRTTGATETECYGYDSLARLTQAWTATDLCTADPATNNGATVGTGLGASSAYWTSWTFDQLGQRTNQTQHGLGGTADTVSTYTYPNPGTIQPHTLTSTSTTGPTGTVATSYGYDAAGNTTSRTRPGANQTLTWTHTGQPASITTSAGTTSYVYDAANSVLLRKDPGKTTLYLPNQELVLNTSTNAVTGQRFYPLPGGGTAIRTGPGLTYKYEISDPHGTGTLALDNTAQIPTWRQTTPYGELRGTPPASWPTNHQFLGKPHNPTTGYTTIGARTYDPVLGRFLSVDPILDSANPQQWAGYTYANNNPTTLSDPSGLRPAGCEEFHLNCATGGTHMSSDPAEQARHEGLQAQAVIRANLSPKMAKPVTGKPLSKPTFEALKAAGYKGSQDYNWADAIEFGKRPGIGFDTFCQNALQLSAEACRAARPDMYNDDIGALVHGILDVAGFIPVLGEIADGINALAYLAEGDWQNAAISAVSLIPGVGDLAKGARYADELAGVGKAGCSFTGDTKVLMADGTTKPIANVKVGDKVLATDPDAGETVPREVLAIIVHTDEGDMTELTVTTQDGETGTVKATSWHLVYNEDTRSFTPIGDLDPGAHLHSTNNTQPTVAKVHHYTQYQPVYDLAINDIHTFHILAGPTPILVHNCPAADDLDAASGIQPSRGSTGRTTPGGANEQRAMDLVKGNPQYGNRLPVTMGDPRWSADDGWVKMEQTVDGVEIHYVYNTNTGVADDFKFKDWSEGP